MLEWGGVFVPANKQGMIMKILQHCRLNPGRIGRGIVLVMGVCAFVMVQVNGVAAEGRPRVIVTTDGEGDDQCSMVRFLLYANDFDVQGIVITSSSTIGRGMGQRQGISGWVRIGWMGNSMPMRRYIRNSNSMTRPILRRTI